MYRYLNYIWVSLFLMGVTISSVYSLDCSNMKRLIDKSIYLHYNEDLKLDKNLIRQGFLGFLDKLDSSRIYYSREDIYSVLIDLSKIDPSRSFDDFCSTLESFSSTYLKKITTSKDLVEKILKSSPSLEDVYSSDISKFIETDSKKIDFVSFNVLVNHRLRPWVKYELILNMNHGYSFLESKTQVLKLYENLEKEVKKIEVGEYFDIFFTCLLGAMDPHSRYQVKLEKDTGRGNGGEEYVGFGIEFDDSNPGRYFVKSLLPNGPAAKSGKIQPADELISITNQDGVNLSVVGVSDDLIDKYMKGAEGSTSILEFNRYYQAVGSTVMARKHKVRLTRSKIPQQDNMVQFGYKGIKSSVMGKDLNIGILRIEQFVYSGEDKKSTSDLVLEALNEMKPRVDACLIDLRGNPGGDVDEAIRILNFFLDSPTNIALLKRHKNSETQELKSSRYTEDKLLNGVFKKPISVIIDQKSASASELFAGAIQDLSRGIILGGQSYGKATMQQINPVKLIPKTFIIKSAEKYYSKKYTLNPYDAKLIVTISRLYRPSGKSLQSVGIVPDIELMLSNELLDKSLEKDRKGSYDEDQIEPRFYDDYDMVNSHIEYLKKLHSYRENDQSLEKLKSQLEEYKKNNDFGSRKSLLYIPQTFDRYDEKIKLKELIDRYVLEESVRISSDYVDSIQKHPEVYKTGSSQDKLEVYRSECNFLNN